MKKSTNQIMLKIFTILLVIITIASLSTSVLAGNAISAADLEANITFGNDTTMVQKVGSIMGTIRNIAVIAAVIVLMIIGVKYILGSVEEKAEYKKTFMPLIIGIVLVVLATSIATFICASVVLAPRCGVKTILPEHCNSGQFATSFSFS